MQMIQEKFWINHNKHHLTLKVYEANVELINNANRLDQYVNKASFNQFIFVPIKINLYVYVSRGTIKHGGTN